MADPRGGPIFPASSLHKGPFCRGQLMVSSCPVVRPLLQQQVPSPTLHLAPVCDLNPDPNLHCSLIFSPSVPPAWEPTLGQLHLAPVSFLPLTWAHRLGLPALPPAVQHSFDMHALKLPSSPARADRHNHQLAAQEEDSVPSDSHDAHLLTVISSLPVRL